MLKATPLILSLISLLPITTLAEESFYLVTCNQGAYKAIAHWFNTPDLKYLQSNIYPDFESVIGIPLSVPWEGWRITGGFTDGTYLQTRIQEDAGSRAIGQSAGDSNDGFQVFTCFKDDNRAIYWTATGACHTDYFCHDIV
jgi:hypothetical protein